MINEYSIKEKMNNLLKKSTLKSYFVDIDKFNWNKFIYIIIISQMLKINDKFLLNVLNSQSYNFFEIFKKIDKAEIYSKPKSLLDFYGFRLF